MKTLDLPRWLSVDKAGHYSSTTGRTIRNWAAAGLLALHPVRLPGASKGVVRVDRFELDRLIETASTLPNILRMNQAATAPADGRVRRGKAWRNRGGRS